MLIERTNNLQTSVSFFHTVVIILFTPHMTANMLTKSLLGLILLCILPTAIMATGLMIPLYIYPGQDWDALISVKKAYPNVPVIAIINPNSGPGASQDSAYVAKIAQLIAAGITIIGYDHTSYGARDINAVKKDMDLYSSFYPNLQGIFFDEMVSATGKESYYSELTSYARSKNFKLTVGNPGVNLNSSYLGTENIFVVYENNGYADLAKSTWLTNDPSQLAVMSINVDKLDQKWVAQACQKVGWVFVTEAKLPNPYDKLPAYLTNLMKTLTNCSSNSSFRIYSL